MEIYIIDLINIKLFAVYGEQKKGNRLFDYIFSF